MESIYKIQAIERDLISNYPRKNDVIHGLFNGLLSRQHVLILGPPGVAKSQLTEDFAKVVEDMNYFSYLMTKYSTPEEIFGQMSFAGLQNDNFSRVTASMLPEANVAFLDEIWKSNSSILNSLLKIMNERKFNNGANLMDVPLDILIGASNEYPEDNSLDALFDRFLLRFWVDCSSDSDSFFTLVERVQNTKEIKTKLTRKEITELQKMTNEMPFTKENNKVLVDIWSMLKHKKYSFSDRRWIKAIKCIKAEAVMTGSTEVASEHFVILKDIMWDNHSDSKKIYSAILKIADQVGVHIHELRSSVEDLHQRLETASTGEINDIIHGVKQTKEKIDALSVDNANNKRLEELSEAVNSLQYRASSKISEMLGLSPQLKS